MTSRHRLPALLGFAALLSVAAGGAHAEGVRGVGYGYGYGGYGPAHAGGYGFADEAVRGAYIGAPFTTIPSPNRIVPAPWSYGTYGVPTLSGIRQAPVAAPSITVINSAAAPRRSPGARILSRNGEGALAGREESSREGSWDGGPRIVSVTVPRR